MGHRDTRDRVSGSLHVRASKLEPRRSRSAWRGMPGPPYYCGSKVEACLPRSSPPQWKTPYSPTHALTPRPRDSPSPAGLPTLPLIDFASRNSASWLATGKSSMARSPPQSSTLSRTRSQPHDAPPDPDHLARERPIPVTKLPRERHLRYRHAHRVGPQRARSLDGTPKAGRPRRGPHRANGRDRSSLARWSSPSPLGPSSRQLPT